MKTLTWADFDQHYPCYSPAESYGEWSGTILDLLQRDDIPAEDRIWAATREGILDDKTLRLFACKCVREVWHLLNDDCSRNAVETAERYAVGEATDDELHAARVAAWVAARAALAGVAARAATWDGANAARASAWVAAGVAASAAACAAANAANAANAAAREKQIQILIKLIQS